MSKSTVLLPEIKLLQKQLKNTQKQLSKFLVTVQFSSCNLSLKKFIEAYFKRLKIFLLYFYDVFDVILREKSSAEVRLIYAERMSL